MLKTENNFNLLLKRIAWINIFFFTLLMVLSVGIFLAYDAKFLFIFPKVDIFKVFFQAARFHLSILAYLNIPVLIIIFLFPLFDSPTIPKSTTMLIKIYYVIGFIALFFFHTVALIPFPSLIPNINSDFIAQIISLFINFDTKFLILLISSMSFIFLSILVIFALTVSFTLKTGEYEIYDRKNNLITISIIIIACLFFARGNIVEHLSYSDHHITPSIQLNKYAQNGIYKLLYDIKNFDPANIKRNRLTENLTAIYTENEKKIDYEFKKIMEDLEEKKEFYGSIT